MRRCAPATCLRWIGRLAIGLAAIGCLWAAAAAAQAPRATSLRAAKKDADREPVPGYKLREINGFRLLCSREVLEQHDKSTSRRKPLEVLELELDTIEEDLPERTLAVLREIPIWVEWELTEPEADRDGLGHGTVVAVYRSGNKPGKLYRFESLEQFVKSNCVEIKNMRLLTALHQGKDDRCVILHEIAHAVHHHVFDYDNPHIKAAYAEAMRKGLYAGRYAAVNEMEYFAELSCAYFDHLEYQPASRDELKTYDPIGYQMMQRTWGTPEEIAKAKRPEREKKAMIAYNAARTLLKDAAKRDEAIASLEAVVAKYADTRGGAEARKLIEKSSR